MQSRICDSLRFVALSLVVAVSVLAPGCDKKKSEETAKVEKRDPLARSRYALRRLDAIVEVMNDRFQDAWLRGTAVEAEMTRLKAEIDRKRDEIVPLADPGFVVADPARHETFLSGLEKWTETTEARFLEFTKVMNHELVPIRSVFVLFKGTSDNLKLLIEAGIECAEEQSRLNALTASHEEGRRYWLSQLANQLAERKTDHEIFQMGIATIKKLEADIKPLFQKVDAGKIAFVRLKTHMSGVEERLAWADRTIALVPVDDPFKKEPAADISKWRADWSVIRQNLADESMKVLDVTRERQKSRAAVEDAAAKFLADLNRPFLDVARRLKLPLPGE